MKYKSKDYRNNQTSRISQPSPLGILQWDISSPQPGEGVHGDDRNCMDAQKADVSIVIEIDIRTWFRKMVMIWRALKNDPR